MSLPPATPTYVLRGHTSTVQALLFFDKNLHLASGDSDGWIVVWSLSSKRAVAVWKGHDSGITGIAIWTNDRLVTHGRDHKLRVWQIGADRLETLERTLPAEGAKDSQPQPWLLHSTDMSALNFCPFASCSGPETQGEDTHKSCGLLIASPNGLDSGGIDIFQLPSERRVSQLKSDKSANTGMVMALKLFNGKEEGSLHLVSGYENGQVMVHIHKGTLGSATSTWQNCMIHKAHAQPVLSLDISPTQEFFITSSADATISKFATPSSPTVSEEETRLLKLSNTKHAGQQGLNIRSDSKVFATAGWDSRVRVYSAKTLKELAVLKWHSDGCYSTAFATILTDEGSSQTGNPEEESQMVVQQSALDVIRLERAAKAQNVHWLAAGGKDGKISLWDIY